MPDDQDDGRQVPRSAPEDIQLLLSDVDGTLVTDEKVLTDATATAAHALAAAGVGFTVTSSRPPKGLKAIVDRLGLGLPIAGFNGGLLVRPDFSVIESHPMDPSLAHRSVAFLQGCGLDVWVYGEDRWFAPAADAPFVAREAHNLGFGPDIVSHWSDAHLARAFKIVGVSADQSRITAVEAAAPNVFDGVANVSRSAAQFLDITHPMASKAKVVGALARRLNVPPAKIATIGDMPNDVLMFQASGFSIAMGNASEAVKRQAHAVTETNQADGFAIAVRKLILARTGAGERLPATSH